MDLHVRNYILYKARTLKEQQKKLERLKALQKEIEKDIIDESPAAMDGMPRGKGGTSDPVASKVIRLEKVQTRISNIEKELAAFKRAEDKIKLTGNLSWRIYNDTIKDQINLEYKALELYMSPRSLYNYRTKLMEMIAEELGEYIDGEDEE